MAPEVQMSHPYQPVVADIFAIGVIMFVLYTGRLPFREATVNDPHFRLIALNEQNSFWKAHEKAANISNDFKDLMTQMLSFQPFMRLNLVEVLSHSFFIEVQEATHAEVVAEMSSRIPSKSV